MEINSFTCLDLNNSNGGNYATMVLFMFITGTDDFLLGLLVV